MVRDTSVEMDKDACETMEPRSGRIEPSGSLSVTFTPHDNESDSLKELKFDFRDLSISKLNYGYIVNVGCHKFAIENKKHLIGLLSNYIDDPNKMESIWWKTKSIESMPDKF